MKTVADKIIVITGAAMGMGKLYARRAVQENAATVVLWDINEAALKDTATELRKAGGNVYSQIVDVGDRTAIEAAARQLRAEVGDPDIVFNNAGVVRGNKYFWETDSAKDTEFTIKINTLAPMFIAREFLPAMVESGKESRLVNVASAAGLTSNPRMASYAGSKWAAIGWSDSVRLELNQSGNDHVKVTTVCPYYVKTGMFEGAKSALLLPLLEPDEVVDEVWKQFKKGTPFVVLPKTALLSDTIKGIVPTPVRDFLTKAIGVQRTMEDFKGRELQK